VVGDRGVQGGLHAGCKRLVALLAGQRRVDAVVPGAEDTLIETRVKEW